MDIGKIVKVPLRELWKKEDKDFTEWLERNIEYLNEVLNFDITIHSREEKVGDFKVDLLGEDRNGGKVIIENQLEKTDHDHLGKILTYLINLEANTAIWITSHPREEHAKVIEWLNETTAENMSFYLVKIEAIKIANQPMAAPLFTIIEEPNIITKQIGAEKKEFAGRHQVRFDFWQQFIAEMNKKTSFCKNLSPSRDNWIGLGLGYSGVSINVVISRNYARTEIYMNRGSIEENKRVMDFLINSKSEIEKTFGKPLTWERMDENVTSRIKDLLDDVNANDPNNWPRVNEFLIDSTIRMYRAFKEPIRKLKNLHSNLR